MNISVVYGLEGEGACGFLRPLIDLEKVREIFSFPYHHGITDSKVKYFLPNFFNNKILMNIQKFFQMIFNIPSNCKLIVGIYEIPHGLVALLVGKIKNIPVCICIIGNPGYKKLRHGFRKKLTYFMLKKANAVTVCGTNSKKILIKNGINSDKIHILPNSIDRNKFKREDFKKIYDIINIGRLSDEKKIEILLKIAEQIKIFRPNISIGIGGEGPEKSNLEKLCKDLGLEKNITFLGYVNDIVKFYNSGKIFVLTSETEGLPRTVLEAMSCGIPCTVPRIGDVTDVAKDGFNSYVVDSNNNIEQYVEKIIRILKDKDLYSKLSYNAVESVKKNYTYKNSKEVWEDILKIVGQVN